MEKIQAHVRQQPLGRPFTTSALLPFGTRANIDQALSRLTKAGRVMRVGRGMYVRPERSKYVGAVIPSPEQVAQAIATATSTIVRIHGAVAANQLGLTTQVPTRPIFITDGPSRVLRIGKLEVTLRHVARRKVALPGMAGAALSALWHLGPEHVGSEEIRRVRQAIGEREFRKLGTAYGIAPAWLLSTIARAQASQRRLSHDEVVAALGRLGAPLFRQTGHRRALVDSELALAWALRTAHRDASVARVLPYTLALNAPTLDFEKLADQARVLGETRALGLFLDLAAALSGDRRLSRVLRLERGKARRVTAVDFFIDATSVFERELAELNSPPEARRWGFRMNMPREAFAAIFDKFGGLPAKLHD